VTNLIELEHVRKTYRSGDTEIAAVDDVTLQVPQGQFVAIMGASGSGKTTLLNIVGCLERPTSGRYRLAGVDVAGLRRSALAEIRNKTIGYVFQQFNLIGRTSARENVELPLFYGKSMSQRHRSERALQALSRVGLGDRTTYTPNRLSGGQQQRVAIARALVNDPKLLLADEPTGMLDTRTSLEVMHLLQHLDASGITIVMVTHEPDIARCAERVITMRDGKIVGDVAQVPIAA
jgi:putative ABC transport system ATP-binding protein